MKKYSIFCTLCTLFLIKSALTQYVTIKCPALESLVLDGFENIVKLQVKSESISQKWYLQHKQHGQFYIQNRGNGRVLSISNSNTDGSDVTTEIATDANSQKWFINFDKTIVNPVRNLTLDIQAGRLFPGAKIIAWPKNGQLNQQFLFENVN